MKLPTVMALDDLSDANFLWVKTEHMYVGNTLPSGADKTGQTTNILIQDAPSSMAGFSNNFAKALDAVVEIQIFFKTHFKGNVFDSAIAAVNAMQDKGWLIATAPTRTTDPDTRQPTVTFYVTRRLKIR